MDKDRFFEKVSLGLGALALLKQRDERLEKQSAGFDTSNPWHTGLAGAGLGGLGLGLKSYLSGDDKWYYDALMGGVAGGGLGAALSGVPRTAREAGHAMTDTTPAAPELEQAESDNSYVDRTVGRVGTPREVLGTTGGGILGWIGGADAADAIGNRRKNRAYVRELENKAEAAKTQGRGDKPVLLGPDGNPVRAASNTPPAPTAEKKKLLPRLADKVTQPWRDRAAVRRHYTSGNSDEAARLRRNLNDASAGGGRSARGWLGSIAGSLLAALAANELSQE